MKRIHSRWLTIPVMAIAVPLHGAEGMRVIGFGTAQTATSGAGIASPQDASWVALNPASLIDLGARIDVDVSDIHPSDSLTPAGPLGNTSNGSLNDRRDIILPDLTAAEPMAGGVLGVGLYTIGGLAINLPYARSSIGALGGFDRRAGANVITAALSYAHEIVDGWAFGAALLGDYTDFRSDGLTRFGTETSGDYRLDHAFGAGFSAGVHKHWTDVSVGIGYISRQWMQRFGLYRDLLDSSMDQPQILQAGIAWRPVPWLEPLLDYRYIDWHGVKVFGDTTTGFGWKSQNIIKLGANAHACEGLVLHAGFSYGRSPIGSSEVFTNGLSPLITQTHLSVGATWDVSPRYHLQVAYLHGFHNTLTDNGADAGGAATGSTISLVVNEVSMGLGYTF